MFPRLLIQLYFVLVFVKPLNEHRKQCVWKLDLLIDMQKLLVIKYNIIFFLIKRHLTHWGYKPNHFQSFTFEYKLQVIAWEIGNRAAHSPQLSLNLSKWRSMINRRDGGLQLAIYRVLALIHWYLGRFNKTNQKCLRRVFKAALLTANS